jgi:hypothetical protein
MHLGGTTQRKELVYKLHTFTSDVAASYVNFFLVDNTEEAGWWNVLSANPSASIPSITAGTPVTTTITITATDTASSAAAGANKLGIATGTDPTGPLTLSFSNFTITKQ